MVHELSWPLTYRSMSPDKKCLWVWSYCPINNQDKTVFCLGQLCRFKSDLFVRMLNCLKNFWRPSKSHWKPTARFNLKNCPRKPWGCYGKGSLSWIKPFVLTRLYPTKNTGPSKFLCHQVVRNNFYFPWFFWFFVSFLTPDRLWTVDNDKEWRKMALRYKN